MYHGSSRFNATLKRASCEIGMKYFLVGVGIKDLPGYPRKLARSLILSRKGLENIPVITMEKSDFLVFQELSLERSIHFGEAEGLAIAKNRGATFLSNDSKVIRFCKASGISVLGLKDILVLIAAKKIVPMIELQKTLLDIEAKDRIFIKSEDQALIMDQFK